MTDANIKAAMPWRYSALNPPYIVMRTPSTFVREIPTLKQAMEEFARIALPAYGTKCAYVVDVNGVLAVGYWCHHVKAEPQWFGIEAGYQALRAVEFVDQLEVTIAEIMSKDRKL